MKPTFKILLHFRFTTRGSQEGTGGSVAHFMAAIAYGKVYLQLKNAMIELMQRSSHLLFVNTVLACLRNLPTQERCCFCRMVTHHKIV